MNAFNLMTRFKYAMHEELVASGKSPVVCVIGSRDYEEICAEMRVMLEAFSRPTDARGVEYCGVKLFKSSLNTRGFTFGCEDVS